MSDRPRWGPSPTQRPKGVKDASNRYLVQRINGDLDLILNTAASVMTVCSVFAVSFWYQERSSSQGQ